MINEILQQVQQEKGNEFAQKAGIEESKILLKELPIVTP